MPLNPTVVLSICASFSLLTPVFGASKSSEIVPTQRRESYSTINRFAKEELNKPFLKSRLTTGIAHQNDEQYDLRADFDRCDSNDRFISGSWTKYRDRALMYVLTNLAIDVARWQKDLKAIGYPVQLFQPAVKSFEDKILSRIDRLTASDLNALWRSEKQSGTDNLLRIF
jgi:hypothetical protein